MLCERNSVYRVLLSCALLASSAQATPTAGSAPASPSSDKLRQFMQQMRPQPSASEAGGNAVRAAAKVTPAQLQERIELLKQGEAALSSMQLEPALMAFERAANILHAADTEIALVRTYMQYGQYRRALASGAHTAGAHLDVVGGSALYAWLLHLGAQTGVAQRLIAEAEARMPGNPALAQVRAQLSSGQPLATGDMLSLPTRMAPYGFAQGIPPAARILGSAVLLQNGKQALVPLSLLPVAHKRSNKLWLRNGLGILAHGTVTKRLPTVGLALVQLSTALPVPDDFLVAEKESFPGSPGYAVEYVAGTDRVKDAAPAWPILRLGFLGAITPSRSERMLGIDMPVGPRGGPVFDGAGRLIGIAIHGKANTSDQLVSTLAAQNAMGQMIAPNQPKSVGSVATADSIYENSLKIALQVIAVP